MSDVRVEQVLEGKPLPGNPRCEGCHDALCEGRPISVIVTAEPWPRGRWTVDRVYCAGCAPSTVAASEDVETALAEGVVGVGANVSNQECWPMITDVSVVETHLHACGVAA